MRITPVDRGKQRRQRLRGVGISWVMLVFPWAWAQGPVPANDPPPAAAAAASGDKRSGSDASAADLKPATLLDEDTTASLHDDSTLLRDISIRFDNGAGEIIFGPLDIWLGGEIQYDMYRVDGIFTNGRGGEGEEGQQMRRLRGVLRASLFDWGELKAQYDFKQRSVGDLYLRWVSRLSEVPYTVTVGNQKEPMGFDNLSGTAFTTAQELPTPEAAFGYWRSMGALVHRSFRKPAQERIFNYWGRDQTAVTASLGVFTQDFEGTNNTALAVTGRMTAGRNRGDLATHVGMAVSLRNAEDNFDQISFRPEIKEADRIVLAKPDAHSMAIGSLEWALSSGPYSLQAEAFVADYNGKVDGLGGGGYVQAAWIVTGEHRQYQTDWGVFAPLTPPRGSFIAEVFSRVSTTAGDDDETGWNAYEALTLGGNVYYRRFKGSINLIYGRAVDKVNQERDGIGVNARLQLLY